ncbi:MAG TPA: ADP-glyceromanno-heptose 6-epimerase [Gammaproteobacteria bacterium]|jgi:ADP-L-glycero-D-manno-heptose 6-epimerase|nr:ADP-glyceromanno-heptose 6-epimerase [Arenicellales bacterium]MDP6551492.1 ADP-glyceromanno-heptose 6-epimerase [Arenicellales bacterium]MDP6790994.1 ADP-glyceromanno-heptose 6-epimerase [Arenicellales bacterium]MDP6918540.1 ADP-glyceromanno-heptose 6-epimerase [Arenicellales bacterium]HCX86584.1 ADP-glyceromanno-heptose 6-epimerase [Gammaproteobacteria bacterium]|tara:strand:- start:131 stop:1132 length:1002 start_codon:yes stop_codon:yes gene_type:complete
MFVVTGGAGFIGSNLIAALNATGGTEVILVDDLSDTAKIANINDLRIADFFDKDDFCEELRRSGLPSGVTAVFHQGACSDTMVSDGRYLMNVNYEYSKTVLKACSASGIPLIYASSASVYGSDGPFVESAENEHPLNAYAFSKTLFDRYAFQNHSDTSTQLVGLRYFNVYGPREAHKGRMASVAWHLTHQYFETGSVRLFEGSDGYGPGEQRRDFIHVDDAVRANLFFLRNSGLSGIFNVGTGKARSFNDVALAVINACRHVDGESAITLDQAQRDKRLNYFAMPEALQGKYQSFTEASIDKLLAAGCSGPWTDVDEGVGRYAAHLYTALRAT